LGPRFGLNAVGESEESPSMWAGRWVNFTARKLRNCDLIQDRRNPCGQVTREINFCTVVPNIYGPSVWNFILLFWPLGQ